MSHFCKTKSHVIFMLAIMCFLGRRVRLTNNKEETNNNILIPHTVQFKYSRTASKPIHFAVHIASLMGFRYIVNLSKTSAYHARYLDQNISSFAGTVINGKYAYPTIGKCGNTIFVHQKSRIRFVMFDVQKFCGIIIQPVEICEVYFQTRIGKPVLTTDCDIFKLSETNAVLISDDNEKQVDEKLVHSVLVTSTMHSVSNLTLLYEADGIRSFIRSSRRCTFNPPPRFKVIAFVEGKNANYVNDILFSYRNVVLEDIDVRFINDKHVKSDQNHVRADWVLHFRLNELIESPWSGISLRRAIYYVDCLGFDVINFSILTFYPLTQPSFPQSGDTYRKFEWASFMPKAAQRGDEKARKSSSSVKGQRTFPINFLLRVYPSRESLPHDLNNLIHPNVFPSSIFVPDGNVSLLNNSHILATGHDLIQEWMPAKRAKLSMSTCQGLNNQRLQVVNGVLFALEEGLNLLIPRLVTGYVHNLTGSENHLKQRTRAFTFDTIFNSSYLVRKMSKLFDLDMTVPMRPSLLSFAQLTTGLWLPVRYNDFRVSRRDDPRSQVQALAHHGVLQLSACLICTPHVDTSARFALWRLINNNIIFSNRILHRMKLITRHLGNFIGVHARMSADFEIFCRSHSRVCNPFNSSVIVESIEKHSSTQAYSRLATVYIADGLPHVVSMLRSRGFTVYTKQHESFVNLFVGTLYEEQAALEQAVLESSSMFLGVFPSSLSFLVRERRRTAGAGNSAYINLPDCVSIPCSNETRYFLECRE